MRGVLLVFALIFPSPAMALDLQTDDGIPIPTHWGEWVDSASRRVPIASGSVRVHQNMSCPDGGAVACVIWMEPPPPHLYFNEPLEFDTLGPIGVRLTLMHEMGHIYDSLSMPGWARQVWLGKMHIQGDWQVSPDSPDAGSPQEQFAESYSIIATYRTYKRARRADVFGGYGFNPTPRQFRGLQRLFRRL